MKRRLALTFAGSAAIVLTAGSAAVAANLGILSSASQEPVGKLDASSVAELSTPATSLDPIVITQDEIIEVPVDDTTTIPAPPAPESDDAPAVSGSSSGPSSSSGRGSGGVSPTTIPRIDNSGPGSIDDDHSGSGDDHSGSGSSGSGSSGSGSSGSGGSGSGGSDDD